MGRARQPAAKPASHSARSDAISQAQSSKATFSCSAGSVRQSGHGAMVAPAISLAVCKCCKSGLLGARQRCR